MPRLFQIGSYKVFFWSNENNEPIHIHVGKGKPSPKEQKMFHWFMNSLDGSVIDYMEDYIEETLFVYFKENKYMWRKVKIY